MTSAVLGRVTLGAALAALALTLFVAWHGSPLPGDVRITREVQDLELLRQNERWLNVLGTFPVEGGVAVVAILVLAAGPAFGLKEATALRRTAAAWTFLVALGLRLLSTPLKQMALSPRPSAEHGVQVLHDFSGYGFPSGHVYGDVLIYGTLAVVAPTLGGRTVGAAIRTFCAALIVLSGPARIVVGAHWPSDCLGGYLYGAAALSLALLAGRKLAQLR